MERTVRCVVLVWIIMLCTIKHSLLSMSNGQMSRSLESECGGQVCLAFYTISSQKVTTLNV